MGSPASLRNLVEPAVGLQWGSSCSILFRTAFRKENQLQLNTLELTVEQQDRGLE